MSIKAHSRGDETPSSVWRRGYLCVYRGKTDGFFIRPDNNGMKVVYNNNNGRISLSLSLCVPVSHFFGEILSHSAKLTRRQLAFFSCGGDKLIRFCPAPNPPGVKTREKTGRPVFFFLLLLLLLFFLHSILEMYMKCPCDIQILGRGRM